MGDHPEMTSGWVRVRSGKDPMVPARGWAHDRAMSTTDTAPPPPLDPTVPDPAPPPPPFGDHRPPFRRSTVDRRFGGVAGGIARHLDVDATLVRIALVVVAVASAGLALAAYAAAWLLVPDDQGAEPLGQAWYRRHGERAAGLLAIVLAGLVAFAALRFVFDASFGWHHHGPDILVIAGVIGIVIASRNDPHGPRRGRRRYGRHRHDQADDGEHAPDPTGVMPVIDPEARRRRMMLRRVRRTSLLSALVAGAGAATLWATGAISTGGWVVPAVVLGCLVAGIAVGPWFGWSWTLVLTALVAAAALAVSLVPGLSLRGGMGERSTRPLTVGEAIRGRHRIGIGRSELDLTGLDLAPGSVVHVRAEAGIGVVQIDVRPEVTVRLRGHISGGTVRLDGEEASIDGSDLDLDRTFPAVIDPATARTEGDASRPATVVVDARVGFGAVQIDRFPRPVRPR